MTNFQKMDVKNQKQEKSKRKRIKRSSNQGSHIIHPVILTTNSLQWENYQGHHNLYEKYS